MTNARVPSGDVPSGDVPSVSVPSVSVPSRDAPLSELQNWMSEILRSPRSLSKSESMREAAARHFTGNDRLSPAEQADIYRRQFWLRHTSLLVEDFPGLSALLGQQRWEPLIENFLSESGGDVFSLRDLPHRLPAHLEKQPQLPDHELLVDMARLECAYLTAFDALDDPVLLPEKLAELAPEAWESAQIVLSHSLVLLQVRYPVAQIRRALRQEDQSVASPSEERQPQNLVVYRRERQLFDKPISNVAFQLLEQFRAGTPLVPACESVCQRDPSAEAVLDAELFEWFALWGRLGWIVDVKASP